MSLPVLPEPHSRGPNYESDLDIADRKALCTSSVFLFVFVAGTTSPSVYARDLSERFPANAQSRVELSNVSGDREVRVQSLSGDVELCAE